MADSSVERGSSDRPSDRRPAATLRSEMERSAADAAKFAELRALLIGPEQRQLHDLKSHLADKTARTIEISGVLPEAIARSANDPDLARALTPPIEQAISAAARRDPQPLAEALFPVIGSSVRRLLGETLTPVITLGAAVVLVAGVWAYQAFQERQRWDDYLARLNAEPGVVVVQSGRRDGKFFVTGLRDDFAVDPTTLIAAAGLSPASVESRWEPYQAIHPPFVLERARSVLRPPEGVDLAFRDGTLTASGSAPAEWLSDSARIAPAILGVRRFTFAGSTAGAEPVAPDVTGAGAADAATNVAANVTPPQPSSEVASLPAAAGSPSPAPARPPAATVTAPAATAAASPDAAAGTEVPVGPAPAADAGPPGVPLVPGSPEHRLVEQIEASMLVYDDGQTEVSGAQEQDVRRLTSLFRELNEIVHLQGLRAYVEVVNHPVEGLPTSAFTARRRASALARQFRSAGFDAVDFGVRADPIIPPPNQTAGEDVLAHARKLTFTARVVKGR